MSIIRLSTLIVFVAASCQARMQIVTENDGEVSPAGVFMLATNRITKVFSEDGLQWIDGTGGVWRVTQTASSWSVYVPTANVTFDAVGLSFPLPDPFFYEYTFGDYTIGIEIVTGNTYDISVGSTLGDYYFSTVTPEDSIVEIASVHELPPALLIPTLGGVETSRWDSVAFVSQLPSASITNGLASIAYVSLATQNLVTASITNGLGGSSVDPSITNGLASSDSLIAATNGLAASSWVISRINSATNGIAQPSGMITNGQNSVTLGGVTFLNGSAIAAATNSASEVSTLGGVTMRDLATFTTARMYFSNGLLWVQGVLQ